MTLVEHAQYELKRAGLLDEDSDYDGMIGKAALEIVEVFSKQGHSGTSAFVTIDIVTRLMKYEPLSDITSDPSEWVDVAEQAGTDAVWQNRRRSTTFSRDGGKTWYDIQDPSLNNGDVRERTRWVQYQLGDEQIRPGHRARVKPDAYTSGHGETVNGREGVFASARNGYAYIKYDDDNSSGGAPHRPELIEVEAI